MIFGLLGATAIEPIDAISCASKIGVHVRPAFSLSQTPPSTAPK